MNSVDYSTVYLQIHWDRYSRFSKGRIYSLFPLSVFKQVHHRTTVQYFPALQVCIRFAPFVFVRKKTNGSLPIADQSFKLAEIGQCTSCTGFTGVCLSSGFRPVSEICRPDKFHDPVMGPRLSAVCGIAIIPPEPIIGYITKSIPAEHILAFHVLTSREKFSSPVSKTSFQDRCS